MWFYQLFFLLLYMQCESAAIGRWTCRWINAINARSMLTHTLSQFSNFSQNRRLRTNVDGIWLLLLLKYANTSRIAQHKIWYRCNIILFYACHVKITTTISLFLVYISGECSILARHCHCCCCIGLTQLIHLCVCAWFLFQSHVSLSVLFLSLQLRLCCCLFVLYTLLDGDVWDSLFNTLYASTHTTHTHIRCGSNTMCSPQ